MVNRANKKNLVYGVDFIFGVPTADSGVDGRNTKVDVIPLRNLNKYKMADVSYARLSVNVLNLLPDGFTKPVLIHAVPFRIHEILPRINEALGLDLVPEEVEDALCESVDELYTLTIKEGSLAWLPSSIEFVAQHVTDIPLESILTVTVLNGLQYKQE